MISLGVISWTHLRSQEDGEAPAVEFLPPLLRRRLSRVTRMALRVAFDCLEGRTPAQIVHGSRYGEYQKTFDIMNDLLSGERASPAAFSQSIHSFAPGLLSIATDNPAPYTTVTAGAATLETAFLEAAGRISETQDDVLFVYADEPIPELYHSFRAGHEEPLALAILLSRSGSPRLRLRWSEASVKRSVPDGMPTSPGSLIEMLAGRCERFSLDDGRLIWVWERDDARSN